MYILRSRLQQGQLFTLNFRVFLRVYQLDERHTNMTSLISCLLSIHRICCKLAELSTQLRNHDNGVRFYREALLHNESHSPARLALAQLHLSKGELEACDHECVTLLRTDSENEQAAVVRDTIVS